MTTRDKLLDAAAEMLATEGLTGLSARTVAARAGVNQALVFYHFGSVAELVESALAPVRRPRGRRRTATGSTTSPRSPSCSRWAASSTPPSATAATSRRWRR